ALGSHPVSEVACLAHGQQGVDEEGILLARNECGRNRWEQPLLKAVRQNGGNGRLGGRREDIVPECRSTSGHRCELLVGLEVGVLPRLTRARSGSLLGIVTWRLCLQEKYSRWRGGCR